MAPSPGRGLPPAARVSERCYRVLLRTYPARFRHAYAEPMALAFRDSCRAATARHGTAGVLLLWPLALWDLIASACAEWTMEGFPMTHVTLARTGGVAAMLVGMLFLVGGYFAFERPFDIAAPATFFLSLLALMGVGAWLAPRGGRVAWLAFGAAMLTTLLEAVGLIFILWGDLRANSWIVAIVLGASELGFAAGMIALGIIVLRRGALPRWNATPLILGVLSLAPVAMSVPAVQISLDNSAAIGPSGYTRLIYLYTLAMAATWFALGVALWPRARAASDPAPATAQPSAALPA